MVWLGRLPWGASAQLLELGMAESAGGDPFIEGLDAALRGAPRDACPYRGGSDKGELWLDGWVEGMGTNGESKEENGDGGGPGPVRTRC